ncbi:hypothetical protein MUK42_16218 [Musa troglodytarum]|nr:hypothetical protein MUK42_16218 [Musa troglodytarum]
MIDLFLLNKVRNLPLVLPPGFSIPELEVYKNPPWELVVSSSYYPAGVFCCFVRVPRSTASDNRLNRKTRGGTWVANGKSRNIPRRDGRAAIVGTRTSLRFFKDSDDPRMKKKKKDRRLGTKWIMREYRLHPSLYATIPSYETEEIILCRIRHKGKGPADDGDDGLAPKAPADAQEMPEPSMPAPATQDGAVDVPGCSGVHGTGAAEDELRMPAPATQDAMVDVLVCCRVPCTRALGKQPWDSAAMLQVEEEAWPQDEIHELRKMLELDDPPAEATAAAETAFAPPVAAPPMAALGTQSADPGCPPPRHTGAMEEEPGFDAARDFLPAEGDKIVDFDIDELLGEFP